MGAINVTNRTQPSPTLTCSVVLLGILAVSTGAILVRYAQQEAGSLAIAAYRSAIAALVMLVPALALRRRELREISYRDAALAALSGFFLAVHFAAWMYSLELTSVAISVVVVNTSPLWVALFTPLVTRDRLTTQTLAAIVLAVLGAMALSGSGATSWRGNENFPGAMWACAGAIGLAVYLLLGRNLRNRLSISVYATLCYGSAAAILFLAAIAAEQPLSGFSPATWSYLVGLAVVSQILGHTANNWALKFLAASTVAVALLGEPILSTLFAYWLFDETLTTGQLLGAVMILVGIYFAARAETKAKRRASNQRETT